MITDVLSWANERLRRHNLRVTRYGREIVVEDLIMRGLSFGLPVETPAAGIVAAAIEGGNARRNFVLGNTEERAAA